MLNVQDGLLGDSVCPSHLSPRLETFFQNHGGKEKLHLENLAPAIKCCDPEVTCVISSHISLARNSYMASAKHEKILSYKNEENQL